MINKIRILLTELEVIIMNIEVKKMFEELCKYCNGYGYGIIEVYFQDKEALLFDCLKSERLVVCYKDGEWE